MLFDLERLRPALLDGIPEAMQRADARVASPGENQLLRAAGANQLVVEEIRRHPNQRQVADALTDDLVARRERNEMREALECDPMPRPDHLPDGVCEGHHDGHAREA